MFSLWLTKAGKMTHSADFIYLRAPPKSHKPFAGILPSMNITDLTRITQVTMQKNIFREI